MSEWDEDTYYTFDECKEGHPDTHRTIVPLCQRIVEDEFGRGKCERMFEDFPHNDIVNPDYMDEKHELVPPLEPLVVPDNARYYNPCPWSRSDDGQHWEYCSCRCHWGIYYVNVYRLFRAYGGPEEGDWWYDEGTPVASVPYNTLAEAEAAVEEMEERFPYTTDYMNTIPRDDSYQVWLEKHFAEEWPKERPHYE